MVPFDMTKIASMLQRLCLLYAFRMQASNNQVKHVDEDYLQVSNNSYDDTQSHHTSFIDIHPSLILVPLCWYGCVLSIPIEIEFASKVDQVVARAAPLGIRR